MKKEKIEIKIESQLEYYFRIMKKNFQFIIRVIFIILALTAVLYVGFYILLFFIILFGINYLFKSMRSN
jgi:hypothetical protein|tara:strand:- start:720 stop:926 length:207 start_codon:yes stop_codon:yes gene_type:complete